MFSTLFRTPRQIYNNWLTTSYKDKLQLKHVDKSFYNLKNTSYKDNVFIGHIPIQTRIPTTSYKDKIGRT
jgi:hypothetical protein